ncbi:MAG: FAD-dependent protein [Polyangiaceae bacterium]
MAGLDSSLATAKNVGSLAELPEEITLELGLDEAQDEAHLRRLVEKKLGIPASDLPGVVVEKRSIDARRGRIRFHLQVALSNPAARPALGGAPPLEVKERPRVVVVGDGPTGLFCAYELARHGVFAHVLERGKSVQPRRHDLKALNKLGHVDADSNYCFGEGGAGTYSDGKLYTRSHKRGNVRDVIELLAVHGAPEAILSDARPHIGSNRLPKVVTALRERLEAVGQKFEFGARVVGLGLETRAGRKVVTGVRLADGREISADAVVLATGHSARDVFEMLAAAGVALEAKSFALGVRIEHPQALINHIQYGAAANHPSLPNAAYRIAETIDGRGVFSFCMCPGGWVVPASTAPGELVVNGMSLARRDSPYANSGLVIGIEPGDWLKAGFTGPLAGVQLQRQLEQAAFTAGGGALVAPATRASDFLARRASSTLPESSYIPGLFATDVAAVLDTVGANLSGRLRAALSRFARSMPGYVSDEAVLIGVESRTSSPVRVPRDAETLASPEIDGLYPAGEGGGYAGGIVSAALDGIRIAEALVRKFA